MQTTYHYPTRILFGEGVRATLADECHRLAITKPLLVTDQGLTAHTSIPQEILKALTQARLFPRLFDAVTPNPDEEQIRAGAAIFTEHSCDGIIGLGGGSPIDAARAIAIAVNHHQPLADYDDLKGGDALIVNALPPFIAMPTTAGTGSEVSRSAVITIASEDRKVVLFSPKALPAVAICDPELTYQLPLRITVETGMDALSHNLEALMAPAYHPMADGIAMKAVALIMHSLPRLYDNAADVPARRDMLMASTMGAVAFQKGLGVVHSLAHPLSSVSGVSHGLANAIMLPHAMRFNAEAAADNLLMLARFLQLPAKNGQQAVDALVNAVATLAVKGGLPTTLSAAGVPLADIPKLVEKAMQDGCHGTNPRPCSAADMETLYKQAF